MTVQRVPLVAIEQPLDFAELDSSNPIMSGIALVVLPHMGRAAANIVTGELPTIGGTLPTPASAKKFGLGAQFSAGRLAYSKFPPGVACGGDDAITILTLHIWTGDVSNYQTAVGIGGDLAWYCPSGVSPITVDTIASGSALLGISLVSGEPNVLILTKTAADVYTVYRDGVAGSSPATISSTWAQGSAIYIGEGQSAEYSKNIQSLVMVWGRVLSDAEIKSISANPWQAFLAGQIVRYIASAGGAVSLSIADMAHFQAADSPSLTTQLLLAIADAAHAQAADNLALQAGALLAVADATHAHALEAPTLTTQQLLAVADALHAQYADNVGLSNAPFLSIQDATHAQVADAFALSVQTLLAIQSASHAHAADGVTLSLGQQLLIVQNMLHAHFADLVALGISGSLLVALERYTLHAAARQFDLSAKKRSTEISA